MIRRLIARGALAAALLAVQAPSASAQAFVSGAYGGWAASTTLTVSAAVSGSNPTMVFSVAGDLTTDVTPACTYNGTSAPLVAKVAAHNGTRWHYGYKIVGPASGTHNIVCTAGSSIFMQLSWLLFSGTTQVTPLGTWFTTSTGSGAALTTTLTTNIINSYTALLFYSSTGIGTSDYTVDATDTDFNGTRAGHSGPHATIGAKSMTSDTTGGSSSIMIEIQGPVIVTSRLLMLGVRLRLLSPALMHALAG